MLLASSFSEKYAVTAVAKYCCLYLLSLKLSNIKHLLELLAPMLASAERSLTIFKLFFMLGFLLYVNNTINNPLAVRTSVRREGAGADGCQLLVRLLGATLMSGTLDPGRAGFC